MESGFAPGGSGGSGLGEARLEACVQGGTVEVATDQEEGVAAQLAGSPHAFETGLGIRIHALDDQPAL